MDDLGGVARSETVLPRWPSLTTLNHFIDRKNIKKTLSHYYYQNYVYPN